MTFRPMALLFCLLALLAAACSGSTPAETSEPADDVEVWTPEADPTEPAESATAEPTGEPAPTPTVGPTATPRAFADNDVLRAAVDAYEDAPLPEGTRSFDVIDRTIDLDGNVRLTVCTWDATSVANDVVDVLVEIEGDNAADLRGEVLSAEPRTGDCIASDMLEAALEFLDEHQVVTAFEQGDPVAPWTDRRLPADLLVEPAWRRIADDPARLDLGICVEMHPDAEPATAPAIGDHLIRFVHLDFDADARPQWVVVEEADLPWTTCRAAASWPRNLIDWQPAGVWRLPDA